MKVITALFAAALVILCIQVTHQVQLHLESGDDVCHLFPDGAVIRKPGTCDETVMCINGRTTPNSVTCPGQGWKLDTKKCAKVTDDYCSKTNCKKNGDQWVADIKNCRDWVECKDTAKVRVGSCPVGQVFDQKQQMCIYETIYSQCDRTYSVCNVSPLDQRYWDKNNCHKYFICNKSQKEISEECPTGTYYEVRTGQCIAKAQVDCYKHPYPQNVCGTTKLAIRGRFVSDKATCRGYFYCQDLGSSKPDPNPNWGQCSEDKFFDEIQEACKQRDYVDCDEDRCDGRTRGRELSKITGCQHYLKCQDGVTVAEEKCPEGKYFDPTTEECVASRINYPICAE